MSRRRRASNCVERHFILRPSPYSECTSPVWAWAVCYTHGKLAVLCMCITDHPYHRSALHRLTNLDEMMLHRRMLSKTLLRAHALLLRRNTFAGAMYVTVYFEDTTYLIPSHWESHFSFNWQTSQSKRTQHKVTKCILQSGRRPAYCNGLGFSFSWQSCRSGLTPQPPIILKKKNNLCTYVATCPYAAAQCVVLPYMEESHGTRLFDV